MNKPVLRSTQMKNVKSLLSSTFGATTTSFRNADDLQTKLQNLKKLQKIIQDKLPNLGLLEQLNFKIVNDLKFLQQLNLQQLDLLDLQQPNLQQQQILSIIRNIKIENDDKISSMLNDLKELKQKLEQFPKEIIQKVSIISPLIELENLTNFINDERSRFQGIPLPEDVINIILKPYIDQQNNLTSETQTVLKELKLPLSSTSNNVLDTLPTEIQELVKRINSYRGFII